jgi:hypothetical protein
MVNHLEVFSIGAALAQKNHDVIIWALDCHFSVSDRFLPLQYIVNSRNWFPAAVYVVGQTPIIDVYLTFMGPPAYAMEKTHVGTLPVMSFGS